MRRIRGLLGTPAGAALLLLAGLVGALLLLKAPDSHPRVRSLSPGATVERVGYPKGPWWRGDIRRSILRVAHIQISHDGSTPRREFLLPPLAVKPQRTRHQAMQRAMELSREARAHPEQFAELARKYSDDTSTSRFGGLIGDVRASLLPAAMVDALGNLEVGGCSYAIETEAGFHVVKRLEVAPSTQYAAEEILISYAGASAPVRFDAEAPRSIEEALRIGTLVAEQATRAPQKFAQLVEQYSEGYSAVQGGRRGTWDSHDSWMDPYVTTAVANLELGAASPPLLTREGVLVLRRVQTTSDTHYAAAGLVMPYRRGHGEHGTDDARPRDEAHADALEMLKELGRDPTLVRPLAERYCGTGNCSARMFVVRERDSFFMGLAPALASVPIGSCVPEVVDTPSGFVVARRIDPNEVLEPPPVSAAFSLPIPEPLSLQTAGPDELKGYLEQLAERVVGTVELSASEREQVKTTFEDIAKELGTSDSAARDGIVTRTALELATKLGVRRAAQISEINDQLMLSLSGVVVGTQH